jgi:hypothetical protein
MTTTYCRACATYGELSDHQGHEIVEGGVLKEDKLVFTTIDRRQVEEEILKLAVANDIERVEILWNKLDIPHVFETGQLKRFIDNQKRKEEPMALSVFILTTPKREGDEGNFDDNNIVGVFASRQGAELVKQHAEPPYPDGKIVEWMVQ